jgi:hypothetical protein
LPAAGVFRARRRDGSKRSSFGTLRQSAELGVATTPVPQLHGHAIVVAADPQPQWTVRSPGRASAPVVEASTVGFHSLKRAPDAVECGRGFRKLHASSVQPQLHGRESRALSDPYCLLHSRDQVKDAQEFLSSAVRQLQLSPG